MTSQSISIWFPFPWLRHHNFDPCTSKSRRWWRHSGLWETWNELELFAKALNPQPPMARYGKIWQVAQWRWTSETSETSTTSLGAAQTSAHLAQLIHEHLKTRCSSPGKTLNHHCRNDPQCVSNWFSYDLLGWNSDGNVQSNALFRLAVALWRSSSW